MKIHGLQKMTLLDFPGHVACTVFLGGCDLRCPFCHNYDLATGRSPEIMDEHGLYDFLEKRRGLLDGVAFTGGEPCLRKDLPDVMAVIREMGFGVKLDTNGLHPDLLKTVLDEKLADYVAMDIKNSPDKYAVTSGADHLDLAPLYESIHMLIDGTCEYEFRTTVVREFHEEKDFDEIGQMIKGARRYFLQQFTDRDTVPFSGLNSPSPQEMTRFADIVKKYVNDVQLRGVD